MTAAIGNVDGEWRLRQRGEGERGLAKRQEILPRLPEAVKLRTLAAPPTFSPEVRLFRRRVQRCVLDVGTEQGQLTEDSTDHLNPWLLPCCRCSSAAVGAIGWARVRPEFLASAVPLLPSRTTLP